MAQDKSAEVTRKLKRVAEDPFLRIMKEADRVDPDRSQSTTTACRRMAQITALDAAITAAQATRNRRPPAPHYPRQSPLFMVQHEGRKHGIEPDMAGDKHLGNAAVCAEIGSCVYGRARLTWELP